LASKNKFKENEVKPRATIEIQIQGSIVL